MRIGRFECKSVDFGVFRLDGGAMFGVVPKVLWEKRIQPNKLNQIPMATNGLVLSDGDEHILVDTGMGTKLPEKEKKIYDVAELDASPETALAKIGLAPGDITAVILSHFHFDHCGGSTKLDGGRAVPAFENATYYIQKAQWEIALNPGPREASSFVLDNFKPLEDAGALKLLEPGDNPIDGIEIIVTNGHTLGQQHVLVKDDDSPLFFCADLIPTSGHLPIPWVMAYDNEPLAIMDEKEAILKRALSENWLLFLEHDASNHTISLKAGKKNLEVNEIIIL